MTAVDLGTLEFGTETQTEFAALAGDWNPLHVDPVFSRRTQGGAPVVHGMNMLVRCLEALAKHSPSLPVPTQVSARFMKPIYSGERVQVLLTAQTPDDARLELRAGNILAVGIVLT